MQSLTLQGRVESGEGLATKLGCPTANIAIEQGAIIPPMGIFLGETEVGGCLYPSLVYISDGSTGKFLKVEVHLLNMDIDLVHKNLKVTLLERTRDSVKYENAEQMSKVIATDLEEARVWFKENGYKIRSSE